MKEIKVRTPINFNELTKYLQHFFQGFYFYEEQKVYTLKNCFILFNGIVLSRLKYVKECFYRPTKYKLKYYPWALKLYLLSFITRWGRKHRINLIDNTTYAIIHQPYINYFHWTIESLSRYLLLEKSTQTYKLILPRYLIDISYIKDSLYILNITNYLVVNSDCTVYVGNLLLPAIVRWGTHNHPDIIKELRKRLLTGYEEKYGNLKRCSHEKLFLIREKGRRKIINIKEVLEVAKRFDFFIIDFEGLPLQEQIAIMSQVKIFVAPHGAGLTNMLFMPLGGSIIEIHINPVKNNNVMDLSYYHLSSNLGHEYTVLISDKNDARQDPLFADHVIPINDLSNMLERVCSKY